MGDFVEQAALEQIGERRYRAVLDSDWMTWGPAGEYVAAIALRAADAATSFDRSASFACQYLSVARFDAVEICVHTLRKGRRSEALRVSMMQDGRPVLDANAWALSENKGLEHDYTQPPEVPSFADLPDIRELHPNQPQLGLFQNFNWHPIDRTPEGEWTVREPVMRGWYCFRPTACAEDRSADAARAVILIDSFSWPATWRAQPSDGPSPWIAPNLDLHVRFHHDSRPHQWLLCETRAELATDGLIGTDGSVWSASGQLIAVGSSQLFCRPRPERFR